MSIRTQTFTDFELLVIDNGSEDSSLDIVRSQLPTHFEVRVFSLEGGGLAAALALGVKEARGFLVARQDQDDVSYPTRLDQQVKALTSNPELVVVGTQANLINEHSEKIGKYAVPLTDRSIRAFGTLFNPFIHSSVMFRRDSVLAVGNYRSPSSSPYPEDFDLWGRLLSVGRGINLRPKLLSYRISSVQVTETHRETISRSAGAIAARNVSRVLGTSELTEQDKEVIGLYHWRSRDIRWREAIRAISLCMRIRRRFGWLPIRYGLPIRVYLLPVVWSVKRPRAREDSG